MQAALGWLAQTLDAAGIGPWVREVAWIYPWANVVHLLGLVLLIGAIGLLDLRILGLWRRLPLTVLSRALTPLAVAGLLIQLVSGFVLFAADGPALAGSAVFQAKLALLFLALTNALAFRLTWSRRPRYSRSEPTPWARLSALCSLALWLAIGATGRLIAYY